MPDSAKVSPRLWLERFLSDASQRGQRGWPDPFRELQIVDCGEDAGCIVFAYHTQPWMRNTIDIVHGGVSATLLDSCMGITCACQCGVPTPTISMTVNYARPVPLDALVHVRTRTVSLGSTTGHVTGEIYLPGDPNHVLVSASGVYYVKGLKT